MLYSDAFLSSAICLPVGAKWELLSWNLSRPCRAVALRLAAGSLRLAAGRGCRGPSTAIARVPGAAAPPTSCGTTEDQPLLGRRDALLLLHPLLDARDRVVALNVDLDLLASQRFYLDLPPSRGQVSVQGVAKTWLRGAARTFMARKRWLDGLRGSQSATCTGEAHSSGSWQFFLTLATERPCVGSGRAAPCPRASG